MNDFYPSNSNCESQFYNQEIRNISTNVNIKRSIRKETKKTKKPQSFECRYLDCNLVFTNRFNLKRHIMLVHSTSRPFHCDICDKRFALLQYYRDHLLLHLSFEEVDQRLGAVSPSIIDRLPLFMVEHTKEEDLLQTYISSKIQPSFVEDGLLPVPGWDRDAAQETKKESQSATLSSISKSWEEESQ